MKRNHRNQFLKLMILLVVGTLTLTASTPLAINISTKRIQEDSNFVSTYASENEFIFTFKTPKITQTEITTDYGAFSLLTPSSGFIGALGKPQIPVWTQLYAVPSAQVTLEILDAHIVDSLDVGRVYPAQQPQTDSDSAKTNEFFFDESFYQQDIEYPGQIVEIKNSGKIRDIPFVKIEFYPVQYNPKQEIATIYDEITISLSWDTGEIVTVESGFDHAPFSRFYENVFPNWQGFLEHALIVESSQGSGNGARETGCDYLIITHPDFYSEIAELANWKHAKGYKTHLVDTTVTGTTSSAIKQYIQDAYDTWDPRPSYLLLVGDAEFIPTSSSGTDLYYATVDGSDYFPDIFHGRIPVDTPQEAELIVDKILTYEQTPPSLASFYENFVVAAYFQDDEQNGYETRRFVRTSEEIRDYLMTENYIGERIYVTAPYINPTHYNNGYYGNGEPLPPELLRPTFAWDGDADDIINAIESGIFILNHRDHGMESGWGDPYFTTSHVSGLTNGELLPVVFSINCLTGRFDGMECFAEEFLRKDGGGAVAVFAATRVSYSGYNDYLCRGFYDAQWPDFDTEVGTDVPMYTLGELLNYGKVYMTQTWGDPWGYEELTFRLFHVFGDPSMEIWTAFPQDLDVAYTLSSDSMEVVVSSSVGVVKDALVCLSQDSGFYAKGLTDVSGTVSLDTTSAIMEEEVTLVVTAHNHLYYAETFFLNQPPNIPDRPSGPSSGKPGVEYLFTTSTIDSDGDDVFYMWRWGDGTYSDWLGPFDSGVTASASHTWTETSNYNIRVKAKDIGGKETDWSESLPISIPYNQPSSFNLFQIILQQFISTRSNNL